MKVLRIEVAFPVAVDLPDDFQQRLIGLIDEVCNVYEAANPGRTMWPAGVGSKITFMPMTREEEEARGLEFDDDTLSIEVAERERYHRWFLYKRLGCECCRDCGVIRRDADHYGPCRGKIRVGPRNDPVQDAEPMTGEPKIKADHEAEQGAHISRPGPFTRDSANG